MRSNRPFKLILLISFIFGGCATFEPALHREDLAATRQPTVMKVQEGLEVSVEEFATADKSRQAFDADVAPYGVLALLVRMENKGTETYKVPEQAVKAILGGKPLTALPGKEAANQAATSSYADKALGWSVLTGPFFGLIGLPTILGSTSHTNAVNERIRDHFESVQFRNDLLKPNQSATGFVYFKLPGEIKKLENLTVHVEANAADFSKQLSYDLALPSLELSAPVAASGG